MSNWVIRQGVVLPIDIVREDGYLTLYWVPVRGQLVKEYADPIDVFDTQLDAYNAVMERLEEQLLDTKRIISKLEGENSEC